MERRVEIRIELVSQRIRKGRKEGPFYFAIETESDGWFRFKFTDKRGENVDPIPLIREIDLLEIKGAIEELVKDSED